MSQDQRWRPADGLTLEPNALSAVTTINENIVVSAGPGAGKTELLAQRADFLLRTGRCPYPQRILALSFKVDAARNLRERVRLRSGTQLAARFDSFTFQAFAKRIIDNYRPALTGSKALNPDYRIDTSVRIEREQITFADLVPLALEIIESNSYASGGIRQTYSHVFLDEFQDCSTQQYQLIQMAFGPTTAVLTAVGDTKQRIMAWAGALEGIMKTFAQDFLAKPLPLYQNFRSAPRLRRMQNRMIAQMDPVAVSSDDDLVGHEGVIEVFDFDTEYNEAQTIADLIAGWLTKGVTPSEITVLVRQKPHLITSALGNELRNRNIPFRNEQDVQDLTAEPIAELVFNFIRVVAAERQPGAYVELMRVVSRSEASDDNALRLDTRIKRMLTEARATIRGPKFRKDQPTAWSHLVHEFLQLVSRSVLIGLSPSYQQGSRLDDLIEQALEAFNNELAVDGRPVEALKRLSEVDAIRFLTIHKCKGLEFEKVVVIGVEKQLFWAEHAVNMSEFFVAISRAKHHLVLTHARRRETPIGFTKRWDVSRSPHQDLLDFAYEKWLPPKK